MRNYFDDLNPDQLQAAECVGHCLTIAAPGSGKTKMLSAKASHLLATGKTVTAVTFTRDSAIELRERIVKQAGIEVLPRLLVGTFHSIDLLMSFPGKARSAMGSEILRHSRSSLTQSWVIVKEGVRRSAVARAHAGSEVQSVEFDDATSVIEGIKSGQVKPKSPEESIMVKIYTEILERHGVIDFQDILLKTNQGLESGKISPLKTDHLLLDEFQDTDLPQLLWSFHHATGGSIITAVGDDDQSIYGFRRALGYDGMLQFERKLSATRIVLGLNYRSHAEILQPAAVLVDKNIGRMEKALVSNKGPGGQALWERFGTRGLEATACAERAKACLAMGQTVGVLCRTNKRLDDVETACLSLDIPYSRTAGDSILNTREMSVFMAAFGCMTRNNAKDADELLAWCQVDESDLAALNKTFGNSIFSAQRKRAELGKTSVKDSTKTTLVSLGKSFSQWKAFIKTGGTEIVVNGVVEILKSFTEDKQSLKLIDVIGGVLTTNDNDLKVPISQQQKHIEDRLRKLRESIERPSTGKDVGKAGVSLLTAHGSKGLEFDMVWIVGAETDAFPEKKGAVQEERRLFYVAMTRARNQLWVSASGKMDVSQFVWEAGLERVKDGTFQTHESR